MKMVATQARQHHRHGELIRYSDSDWSRLTKPTPKSVPALKVSQYPAAEAAAREQAHADADDDAVATRPSIGFRNPKTAAWLLFMMFPQDTTGLRLDPGAKFGSSRQLDCRA